MNLKNNKGYVGTDASLAILVLMIIIPTITGMIYNVNKTNNLIDKKTEALSIAINTIETAKGIEIEELDKDKVIQEMKDNLYSEIDVEDEVVTLTQNENTYQIVLSIEDYANTEEGQAKYAEQDKVKIVTAIVKFMSGKQENNIELNTVIS